MEAASQEITGVAAVLWGLVALGTMIASAMVALNRNIVHAAFSLLFTLMGVAGLYGLAGADFIAVVQVLLYVGGILVLLLFAVMLTNRIGDPEVATQSLGVGRAVLAVALLGGLLAYAVIVRMRWPELPTAAYEPTTEAIGNAFLGDFLLPFEVASVLLLAAVVGAVVIARRDVRGGAGDARR